MSMSRPEAGKIGQMNPSQTALTDALVAARRGNRTLDATPWLDTLETADQAYEVQDAVAAALGWFGAAAVPGTWKSGGGSQDKFKQFIGTEIAKWAKVVKDGNVHVET